MVHRWSLAIAFFMGIASFSVYPLGLGEIQLNSALNQHLQANIGLLSINPDEVVDVSVKLASPADFKRAGIERTFNLTRLRFRPRVGANGKPVIQITSRDPVREPFLNFLLEVNWPNGRILREYTLLLDPPVTMDRRPAPVQPALAQTAREEVPVTDSPATASAPAPATTGEYGPVRKNETLWRIAEKVRPDGVTIEQMMIALQRANTHAFIDDNINLLKVGKVLRIPAVGEAQAISTGEARDLFNRQTKQWRSGLASKAVADEPSQEPVPAEDLAPTPKADTTTDKLKIAAPKAGAEDAAGPGADTAPAEAVEKLEQALITAKEERESAIQEGEELKTTVGELESQLTDLQKLLDLKENQLARLEETLAQEREGTTDETIRVQEPTTAEGETDATAQVDETIQIEVEPSDEALTETPEATTAVEEAQTPEIKPAAEPLVTTEAGEEKGFLQKISGDPTILGTIIAVIAVLLAMLWVAVSRRRSSSTDFQESILVNTSDDGTTESLLSDDQITHTTETTSFLSDFTPSDIDALQDETGDVDPLAEADVYIAYGRYQQAEELIRHAIEKDPERNSLKHKLFEILYVTKNAGAFSTLAKSSIAQGLDQQDPDGWTKIKTMGIELLPDNELFGGESGSSGIDSELTSLEAALDKRDDLDKLSGSVETDSLLFDGLDSEEINLGELAADDQASATETADLDFDLGLDLDLGGESEKELEAADKLDPTMPAGLTSDQRGGDNLDLDLDSFTDIDEEAASLLDVEDTLETTGIENLDISDEILETEGLPAGESGDSDEISTKLDLARAYVEMGDSDGAKDILEEVLVDGNQQQQQEAKSIIEGLV